MREDLMCFAHFFVCSALIEDYIEESVAQKTRTSFIQNE
jgi:hypothetical protein